MKFRPKEFVVPSLILHGSAIVLLIILCWKVPTIKTPKEKQFRVNLVQLPSAPPVKAYTPPAKKATPKPVKKVSKPKPKPKPKPKKKVKPKPRPKPKKKVKPKPKPKPKPKLIKRKILPPPKKIIKRKPVVTNKTRFVKWKSKPKPKTVYQKPDFKSKDAFKKSREKLKELERSLNQESSDLKKKMDSYVRATRFTAGASGAQATIINNFFQQNILTAIDNVWTPPSAALVPRKSQCTIAFTLSKNGSVSNVRIVRRSGFSVLDDSAKSAIQQANFPAFPADLNKNSLNVEVPFVCEPNE